MSASYFENFPYIAYTITAAGVTPKPGEIQWVKDIFRRVSTVNNLLTQKQMFYDYQILEGETPEILADRLYGSVKYFWVVTLINNITDPLMDWPKSYANMVLYITDKYGSIANAATTIHHYTRTEKKVDSLGNSNTQTFITDANNYALSYTTPVVTTFPSGATVTKTITKEIVYADVYENDLNEAKRNITLVKDTYIPQLVSQLESLLA